MKTCKWITMTMMALVAVGLVTAGAARAGSLTPSNAPAPTMHTLEEIYQQLLTTQLQVVSNQQAVADMQARMVASGMQQTSGDMVLIPAGSFVMGACTNVGQEFEFDEVPQHAVTLSAFYMDKYEVTSNLWGTVCTWSTNKGYVIAHAGESVAGTHPVRAVNWFDAIAWCNARSQRDGFTPCYTNGDGSVYTNSAGNSFSGGCNWAASGYRLPKEAEWEKAARGGVANRRFPWADANTIQHVRANYSADPSLFEYDTNPKSGYHPLYIPYTSPVGSFAPNGYGLYDMAGNVMEWCWDWHSSSYYSSSPASDPTGPIGPLTYRVLRGGSYATYPSSSRVARRWSTSPPETAGGYFGFRCVRGL
jgi:formylglycine-generating enzyme required for sulfatase activity